MEWFNFLHLYQPANSSSQIISEAADSSYWRLLRLMEENGCLKMTWNISGCLLERMSEGGLYSFISRLQPLVASGRLELVSSAAYHGFLPLLPEKEARWQIEENLRILRKHFGQDFSPAGFFLPEMAYSKEIAILLKEAGYRYIVLDKVSLAPGQDKSLKAALDKESGLEIVFRDEEYSNCYPPDRLYAGGRLAASGIAITATDAELYGLRHQDPTGELEKIVKDKDFHSGTFSEMLDRETAKSSVLLRPSTWETTEEDIAQGLPYALWSDPRNVIQSILWKMSYKILEYPSSEDPAREWFRWHLSRGLASCTFWWASGRDLSRSFGPVAWNPDEVEKGLNDLVRAARSLEDESSRSFKLEIESMASDVSRELWQQHWTKHWKLKI